MPFVWIILIVAVFYIISRITRGGKSKNTNQVSALDILKKRYVKGEITKEQYDQMKHDID